MPIHRISTLVLLCAWGAFAAAPAAAPSGASAPAQTNASAPRPPVAPTLPPGQSPAPVPQGPSADSVHTLRGTAFDTERKVPAYTEKHQERYRNGRHVATRTLFLTPEGRPMAERELDFARFPFKPDYLFKDVRNGYEEGARVESAGLRVHFRDSAKAPLHEKRIQVPEPCVINGGVGLFLKDRWKGLEQGGRIEFNMVVPARLDYFRFVAYADPARTLPETVAAGRRYRPIVIEPRSTVLRMLLPTIVMYYDLDSQRLIRYQGIVNVADAKGRSLRVRVDYPDLGP